MKQEVEALPYFEKLLQEFEKSQDLPETHKRITELKAAARKPSKEECMRRTVSCSSAARSSLCLRHRASMRRLARRASLPLETAVACAAPLTTDNPMADAPRIIGAQDMTARALYGPRDLLVVERGHGLGPALGQQFFVRRANRFGSPHDRRWQGARTLGWVRSLPSTIRRRLPRSITDAM